MKILIKIFGWVFGVLVACGGAAWFFCPHEPADLTAEFDSRKFGEGVQVYFESIESAFDDITNGVEKRVVWAEGGYEAKTPYSIVYIHGFSATSEEIRPIPDRIAAQLGANLVYTRLAGHGRDGEAMAEATVEKWMTDVAEALAAGRAVGEEVIVISTSTGGTLASAAALDETMGSQIAAMIFVSPNFQVNDPFAFLLGLPGVRVWAKWLVGPEQSFEPKNDQHAKYWTYRYPTEAVAPMGALLREVNNLDFSKANQPALFWYSQDDQVVVPEATAHVAAKWGGLSEIELVEMGPGDDPGSHVVAGDIASPGQTDYATQAMLDWLKRVGVQ